MITVTGRTAAIAVLTLAGLALTALGVLSMVTNRVTGHEALTGFIALLIGTAAALWLRRDKRGGTS
jgi:hypothetical protein